MKFWIWLGLFVFVAAGLQIVGPGTLYVKELSFRQAYSCRDKATKISMPCEITAIGMPTWMSLVSNTFSLRSEPVMDSIERMILRVSDSQNKIESRVIVIYVDYHYQQENASADPTTTTTTTTTTTYSSTDISPSGSRNVSEHQADLTSTTTKKQTSTNVTITTSNVKIERNQSNQGTVSTRTQIQSNSDRSQRYLELLNRQSRAHEKVAYYLAMIVEQTQTYKKNELSIQVLELRHQELISKKSSITKEIAMWQSTLTERESRIQIQNQEIYQLNLEIQQFQQKILQIETQLSQKTQQLSQTRIRISQLESEIKLLESEIVESKAKLSTVERKCSDSQKQIEVVQIKIQQDKFKKVEIQRKITSYQQNTRSYELQIENLQKEIRRIETQKIQNQRQKSIEQNNLIKIESQIKNSQHSISLLQKQCDNSFTQTLQIQINKMEKQIVQKEISKEQITFQAKYVETELNELQKEVRVHETEIQRKKREIVDSEKKIIVYKEEKVNIQTEIRILTTEITKIQAQISRTVQQISTTNAQIASYHKDLQNLHIQLREALIEKQIVDGLIKKILLGENSIIGDLGFEQIFQNDVSVPDLDIYADLSLIQRKLSSIRTLFDIKLVSGNALREEDRNQCEGIESAAAYGSGKITSIYGNEVEVLSSDGSRTKLKVFSCSLNLAPIQFYTPQPNDLICWRGFNYNNFDVVIESLIFPF